MLSRVIERPAWVRFAWGGSWGVLFGGACSMLALVQWLLQGPTLFDRHHLTLSGLVATYLIGGAVGGAIAGALLIVARWKAGAAAIGVLTIVPLGAAIQFLTLGDRHWDGASTATLVIGALAIGIPSGIIYHE